MVQFCLLIRINCVIEKGVDSDQLFTLLPLSLLGIGGGGLPPGTGGAGLAGRLGPLNSAEK